MGKLNNCKVCKVPSCGNDKHTNTKYKLERNVGDRLKVILLQVYDMIDQDNLQKYEIISLLNALVEEHIIETEE